MSDRSIFELADIFGPDLQGVPWGELEEKLNATAAEIVYDFPKEGEDIAPHAVYAATHYVGEAYEKAKAHMEGIRWPWEMDSKMSMDAWNSIKADTLKVSNLAVDSIKNQIYYLAGEEQMTVDSETFRAIVCSTYLTALEGGVVQLDLMMQKLNRPAEEIIAHLDSVVKCFEVIDFWAKEGMFDALKAAENMGVGAVPVAIVIAGAVVISITALSIVSAIAWVQVESKKVSSTNKAMANICDKATAGSDPELIKACVKLAESNAPAAGPDFGLNGITKLALIGGGIYLLFLFGPSVATAIERRQRQIASAS